MDLWEALGISRQVGLMLAGAAVVVTGICGLFLRRRSRTQDRTLINLSDRD